MGLPQIASYPLPTADNLPVPRAPFSIEPRRAALLIHDMQRYFCAPFLQDAAPMAAVLNHIGALQQQARARAIPVFYSAQKGDQVRADRGLQAVLWGPGMSARPEHEGILPQIAPRDGDIVLVKHRYSAFQRSNLEALMRARGRDQLLIAGVYAHIGCLATAAEAFQLDIEPFAIADAQADFDQKHHEMALRWVADCCGGVATTADMLKRLSEQPG